MTKRVFKCARVTQRTAELRCYWMLTEYTQDEYCDIYGNSHFVNLVNVIHTLMIFDDCSSVTVRQERQHQGQLGKQLSHGLCFHQPINMTELQLWEESSGKGYAVLYENQDSSSWYSSKFFSRNRTLPPVRVICCRTVVLYVCFACNCAVLSHLTETSTEHIGT